MQEGGMAEGAAVGEGGCSFGSVKNELNAPVFDDVYDVGAAFEHLIDLADIHPLLGKVTLGAGRCDALEAERGKQLDGRQDARLVVIAHGDEDGAGARQAGAAADLALGERDL